jgi:predicted RNase H-like HicB family nuclease
MLKIDSYRRHKYHIAGGFMVARKFTVFLQPAEEGGFVVKCLELPVATQGETRKEALKNIKEAIEGYLEVKTKLLGRKIKGEKVEVIVEAPTALLA